MAMLNGLGLCREAARGLVLKASVVIEYYVCVAQSLHAFKLYNAFVYQY